MSPRKQRQAFELAFEGFLEHCEAVGWSPRTVDSYRSHLAAFLRYLEAETEVAAISEILPDTVHAYQTFLYTSRDKKGRPLAIATQAARLCALRSFFRWLVQTDSLVHDPTSGLTLPKRKGLLPRNILSKREIASLLSAPDARTPLGLRDRAILEILYSTGIRNAELRALRVYDVDFDRGIIRIEEGKNAKDRVIPLGRAAGAYVKEYIQEGRPGLLNLRGVEARQEPSLFLSKAGRPLLALAVIYAVRKHAKQAGIQRRITPHILRHTFATHLLRGRADLRHIQTMLGHSSVATTQIYTRVEITDLKKVHRRCHPREKR